MLHLCNRCPAGAEVMSEPEDRLNSELLLKFGAASWRRCLVMPPLWWAGSVSHLTRSDWTRLVSLRG